MKILVTGCAGFIGSNLSKRLVREGISVVGVDNLTKNYDVGLKKSNIAPIMKSRLFKFLKADINDGKLYKKLAKMKITNIVHLAALTGVRKSTEQPDEYLRTNISGTLKVLEFAKGMKAPCVLASTSSVYGTNRLPFSEQQPTQTPLSIYAASKIGMESLAYSFHSLHNLPITMLRFFTVYGPGGRPDMAVYKFAKLISEGKPIEVFGDGSAKRDFTFVSDVEDAIILCLQRKAGCEAFNVGNSDSRSIMQLILLLENALGRRTKIRFVPAKKEDVGQTLADLSKARRVLGYAPKVKLENGVKLFAEWFGSRGKLF